MKYLVIALVLAFLVVGGAAMATPPSATANAGVSLSLAEFVSISYPGTGYAFTEAPGFTGTDTATQNFTVSANTPATVTISGTPTLTGPDTGANAPTIAASVPSPDVTAGTSAGTVGVKVDVTVPSQATLAGSYTGSVVVQIAANS